MWEKGLFLHFFLFLQIRPLYKCLPDITWWDTSFLPPRVHSTVFLFLYLGFMTSPPTPFKRKDVKQFKLLETHFPHEQNRNNYTCPTPVLVRIKWENIRDTLRTAIGTCKGLRRRRPVLSCVFLIWFCPLSWARPPYRSCWIRLYSRGAEEKIKLEEAETVSRDYSLQDFGEVKEKDQMKVFRRGRKVPSKGKEKPVMSRVFKGTRVRPGVSILRLFCVFPNGQSYRFAHDLVQYEKVWKVRDFQNKYSIIG